jgi:hypothetical protein
MVKFTYIRTNFHIIAIIIFSTCTNLVAEKEEAFIRARISLHNSACAEFVRDSIHKRDEIWDSIYYPGKSKYTVEVMTDSIISTIYKNKNFPYSPDFDHYLTYARFMDWCNEKLVDPVKAAANLK